MYYYLLTLKKKVKGNHTFGITCANHASLAHKIVYAKPLSD